MSSLINKAKDAVSGDKHNTHGTTNTGYDGTTTGSATVGPHSSNLANKGDPRVDSDMDHRGATGGLTGTGHHGGVTGTGTRGGVTGTGTHGGVTGGNHGGITGTSTHSGMTGGTTGGMTGTSTTGATNYGPHSSNLANKADPRVDSDLDNRGVTGGMTGTTGYGSGATGHGTGMTGHGTGATGYGGGNTGYTGDTGGLSSSTNAGPHNSNLINKADPRVDSDLDNRGTHHHGGHHHGATHATPGSGNAQNTAGPHNSDMLNKLDPRVDSDMDGSKTMGGNKTHTSTSGGFAGKDPRDAAQVPPSVLAEHLGDPHIAHDDHTHDRARRHSAKTGDSLRDYGGGHE